MRKVTSLTMLFVMVLNLISPLIIDAKQIDNKIESNKIESKKSLAPTDIVNIPDDVLKACINLTISQPADSDITRTQMESLTTLHCYAAYGKTGVVDITGIEYAINLTELWLYMGTNGIGGIEDISLLSGLTNLTNLKLSGNKITDVSPLSGLTNLTSLDLSVNKISDISPISGLTNLTIFGAGENKIEDISPVKNLTNLERLIVEKNQINDISPISGLTNLTSLYMSENKIEDISPISGLTNLTYFEVRRNQIVDISPISKLTNLDYLYLDYNEIEDVSPLKDLDLDTLDLNWNHISDFSSLKKAASYKVFDTANQVINIDLGTFKDIADIPTQYKMPIIYADGTREEVTVDIDPIVEGENNSIDHYSFYSISGNQYNGTINITFNYSPSSTNEKPVFTGVDDVTLNMNDAFDPMAGVSASDKEDGDLTPKINVFAKNHRKDEPTKDELTEGEYVYYYSVTDSAGAESKVERKVTVTSGATNEKPVIDGINDVTLNINDTFDPMAGVSASDKEDGDLTSKISITNNNLVVSKVGSYKITYSVTDSDGNKTDGSRNIKVIDNSTSKPGGGGDITPMKPGDKNDNQNDNQNKTLSKTGSNMLVISISAIAALLLIKKSYKF